MMKTTNREQKEERGRMHGVDCVERVMPARASRGGAAHRIVASCVLALVLLAGSVLPAAADSYDETMAGHPLRIVAYVLHPVGVALDYLLFRPAHWLVSHEPLETLFGHEED